MTQLAVRAPPLTTHPQARRIEALLLRMVLQTVLTEENISRVLAATYDAARDYQLTTKDVQRLVEDTERLALAEDRTSQIRELLGRFIDEIWIRAKGAAVHYSIPLPEDSPLAGMYRQKIDLPEDVLS